MFWPDTPKKDQAQGELRGRIFHTTEKATFLIDSLLNSASRATGSRACEEDLYLKDHLLLYSAVLQLSASNPALSIVPRNN